MYQKQVSVFSALFSLILVTVFAACILEYIVPPTTAAQRSLAAVSEWQQESVLLPNGVAAGDLFGFDVAIDGDTAVVGAWRDDIGANTDQGSVYVFTRSGTVWTQQALLTASDGNPNDRFGTRVAIDGDTVVVGVNSDDVGTNRDQGSAYVFTRTGTVWTQQTQLNATNGLASSQFGASVGLSGETAIVGVNNQTNGQKGSVTVFTRSGAIWTQQAQLYASDGTSGNDIFGWSVGIAGDTIVAGAGRATVGANSIQGSAYVFTRSGTVWTEQAKLTATGGAALDFFGISVAIGGNTIVVGAHLDDVGTNSDEGSAYVFTRSDAIWTQRTQLNGTGGAVGDNFGRSVGISGDRIAIGAATNISDIQTGKAYIFSGPVAPVLVAISGRVLTPDGRAIRNAVVSLTDSLGVRRTATTSSFGLYSFDNVTTGVTYTIGVSSKRYRFGAQVLQVDAAMLNVDFVGLE